MVRFGIAVWVRTWSVAVQVRGVSQPALMRSPGMILACRVSGSSKALVERVRELESMVEQQRRVIAEQVDRIAELQRRLGQGSSTSSRPPSSDAPWDKKPARNARHASGRVANRASSQGRRRGAWSRTRTRPPRWPRIGVPGVRSRWRMPPRPGGCTARWDVDPPPPRVTEPHRVSAGVAALWRVWVCQRPHCHLCAPPGRSRQRRAALRCRRPAPGRRPATCHHRASTVHVTH